MAEKILNTRILLKYDTLENWEKDLGYLRKGEVAIATVTTDEEIASASKLTGGQPPQVLIKVGDGSHKFSELPYVTAKAGDVYSWAKEKTLKYEALPKELKDEIDALQAAVGTSGSVSDAITAAIETLDVVDEPANNEFVVAVPQVDGKVAPVRRALVAADIPTIEEGQVNGLTKKLGDLNTAIEAEATARGTAVEGAKTYAEGLVNALANDAVKKNTDAIAEIKDETNGILAQAKADATQKANDAKADAAADATAKANAAQAAAEATAAADATSKADTALASAKEYTNTKISEVNGVAEGLAGRVETIENDYVKNKALSDEVTRAREAEQDLQTQIDTILNNPDTEGVINSINEFTQYIEEHGEIAEGFRADIDQNKADIDAIEADYLKKADKDELAGDIADEITRAKAAEKVNADAIGVINGNIGAVPTGKTLIGLIGENTTAINTEKGRAEAAEASLLAKIGTVADGQNLAALITANTNAISDEAAARSAADTTHTNDIKAINNKLGEGTPTAGTTLVAAINANTAAITAEKTRAEAAEAQALTDAKAYTDAEVKELADGQVKANADAIAAINGDKNIVKSVKFENVSGKTPAVLAGEIANNELTVKFDDTLTFILNSGNAATADQLDETAQG